MKTEELIRRDTEFRVLRESFDAEYSVLGLEARVEADPDPPDPWGFDRNESSPNGEAFTGES